MLSLCLCHERTLSESSTSKGAQHQSGWDMLYYYYYSSIWVMRSAQLGVYVNGRRRRLINEQHFLCKEDVCVVCAKNDLGHLRVGQNGQILVLNCRRNPRRPSTVCGALFVELGLCRTTRARRVRIWRRNTARAMRKQFSTSKKRKKTNQSSTLHSVQRKKTGERGELKCECRSSSLSTEYSALLLLVLA